MEMKNELERKLEIVDDNIRGILGDAKYALVAWEEGSKSPYISYLLEGDNKQIISVLEKLIIALGK